MVHVPGAGAAGAAGHNYSSIFTPLLQHPQCSAMIANTRNCSAVAGCSMAAEGNPQVFSSLHAACSKPANSCALHQMVVCTCMLHSAADVGFGVGHTRETETKGIWIWGEPKAVN